MNIELCINYSFILSRGNPLHSCGVDLVTRATSNIPADSEDSNPAFVASFKLRHVMHNVH